LNSLRVSSVIFPLFGWIAIASTAFRNSAELGLTTSVFFARFVAMRRSGKKISDRIQSAVIGVYTPPLTLRGEMQLIMPAHLDRLPQRLTQAIDNRSIVPLWRLAFAEELHRRHSHSVGKPLLYPLTVTIVVILRRLFSGASFSSITSTPLATSAGMD
jgi:hypothetical protein